MNELKVCSECGEILLSYSPLYECCTNIDCTMHEVPIRVCDNTRVPDPRLQEAVREIEDSIVWDFQTFVPDIIEVLRKHIPELKEK